MLYNQTVSGAGWYGVNGLDPLHDPSDGYVDGTLLALQALLTQSILRYADSPEAPTSSSLRFEPDFQQLPFIEPHLPQGRKVPSSTGTSLSLVGPCAVLLVLVTAVVVGERETGRLSTLRLWGMAELLQWVTWFLVFFAMYAVSIVPASYLLPALQVEVFQWVSPSVIFTSLLTSGAAHIAFALVLATLIPKISTAMITCVLAVVLAFFFTTMSSFWGSSTPFYDYSFTAFLKPLWAAMHYLIPPVNIAAVATDVYFAAQPQAYGYDPDTGEFVVKGPAQDLTFTLAADPHASYVQYARSCSFFYSEKYQVLPWYPTDPDGEKDYWACRFNTRTIIDSAHRAAKAAAILIGVAWYLGVSLQTAGSPGMPFYFPLLPSWYLAWPTRRQMRKSHKRCCSAVEAGAVIAALEAESEESLGSSEGRLDPDVEAHVRDVLMQPSSDALSTNGVLVVGVRRRFGAFKALKGVTLAMPRGKNTGLLGHNGAAKSVLFSIILGIRRPHREPPAVLRRLLCQVPFLSKRLLSAKGAELFAQRSAGLDKVFVLGLDGAKHAHAIRRAISVCPQFNEAMLWPAMSPVQHLRTYLALRDYKDFHRQPAKREAAIKAVLERLDLWTVRDKPAGRFSGGMQRRLCVALALIGSPSFTLLDECSAGTDPASREMMWAALKDSLKDGRGICSISHDMSEVSVLSSQVAILSHGQLSAFGTPMRLKDRFGSGYILEVSFLPSSDIDAGVLRVEAAFAGIVASHQAEFTTQSQDEPPVDLSSRSGTSVSFAIATYAEFLIPELYRLVSPSGPLSDIVQHRSLTQSSLDEVFLELAEREEAAAEAQKAKLQKAKRPSRKERKAEGKAAQKAARQLSQKRHQSTGPSSTTAAVTQVASVNNNSDAELVETGGAFSASDAALEAAFNPVMGPPHPLPALLRKTVYLNLQKGKGLFFLIILPCLSVLIMDSILLVLAHISVVRDHAMDQYIAYFTSACETCETLHDHAYCWDYTPIWPQPDATPGRMSCSMRNWLSGEGYVQPSGIDLNDTMFTLRYDLAGVPQILVVDNTPNGTHTVADFIPPFRTPGSGTSQSTPLSREYQSHFSYLLYPYDSQYPAELLSRQFTALGFPDPSSPEPSSNLFRNWPLTVLERWTYDLDYNNVYLDMLLYSFAQAQTPSLASLQADVYDTLEVGWPPLPDYVAGSYYEVSGLVAAFGKESVYPTAIFVIPEGATPETKDYSISISSFLPPDWRRCPQQDYLWHDYENVRACSWYSCWDYFFPSYFQIQEEFRSYSLTPTQTRNGPVPWTMHAYLESHLATALLRTVVGNPTARIVTGIQALPIKTDPNGYMLRAVDPLPLKCCMVSICTAMAIYSLLPTLVRTPVYERHHRIRALLQLSGVRSGAYWTASILFALVVGAILSALIVISAFFFDIGVFTRSSVAVLFAWFVLGALAINQAAMLVAALVSSQKLASICAAGICFLAAFGPNFVFMGDFTSLSVEAITFVKWYHYWVAPIAFVHGMRVFSVQSVPDLATLADTPLPGAAACILATTVAVFILVVYLDEVIPRKNQLAITRSAIYPIHSAATFFRRLRARFSSDRKNFRPLGDHQTVRVPLQHVSAAVAAMTALDEDVAAERQALADGAVPDDVPLRVANLQKVFGDGKMAVVDVAFHIARNEVFGLLGVNGAGKSTAIACMCGLLPMTDGAVSICGIDMGSRPFEAARSIGMSPQTDIYWPDITVERTLRIFAQMKGVVPADVERTATSIAHFVGLDPDMKKKASELSGGMRRRLTFAIALIGAPTMLALDEITAGVDPATKRLIFRAVQAAKASRAVLVTTHDLDEASAVADRLAIMQAGTLRCIGTLPHLKARFGLHYNVEIQPNSALSLVSSDAQGASAADTAFVTACGEAMRTAGTPFEMTEIDASTGTRTYRVPPDADIALLFQTLLDAKRANVFQAFSVSFATLRDLFLRIAREG
jgi:ABC-type multidrug transport system ATPase subunit